LSTNSILAFTLSFGALIMALRLNSADCDENVPTIRVGMFSAHAESQC
jgi:hypothetical protein